MPDIHPSAIVAPEAEIGEAVEIGPYTVIGPHVKIGSGTKVMAHVFLDGHTSIGSDCTIFPFASIGTQTQDLKYSGGNPGVEIGDRNTFREYVTVNAATDDGDRTRVGSDCHIMAYAHIAHDCIIGDGVIMANCGTLAGHVIIEDRAIIGGLTGVHQFVRVGRMTIVGGCSKVTQDVPPFMMADGHPLEVRGINSIGLKRREVDKSVRDELKKAYKIIYREDLNIKQAVEKIEAELESGEEMNQLTEFLSKSERGITR